MSEFHHISVLLDECIDGLNIKPDGVYVDGTLGGAGHSFQIAARLTTGRLIGIDRDPVALAAAGKRLEPYKDRVTLVHSNFCEMAQVLEDLGIDGVDGILMDLGVSSPQLDHPERGFSWRADGPLDMRMDQRNPLTASRILNFADADELARIFREYGEEPKAGKLARAIVEAREKTPFATTADLVAVCDRVIGRKPGKLPAPTLAFQALRIAVNDELGELERVLPDAVGLLNKNGRLAVISFHSLEDRIVKEFFREEAADCTCPPGLPVCVCGKVKRMEIITRKGVTASKEELDENKRSACARLRVAEKLI